VKIVPEDSWDRTPFAMAISRDEGKTWGEKVLLEDDPRRGYCYTAIHFTDDAMLLAYCCGGHGHWPLQDMKIVRLPRNKESFIV
ncbi:MAG: exo-alpha-sialidase, partial [Lentisphaeria bacterium]|nr:exo-alpha-sialidase [Lentisphaeria bacterium]